MEFELEPQIQLDQDDDDEVAEGDGEDVGLELDRRISSFRAFASLIRASSEAILDSRSNLSAIAAASQTISNQNQSSVHTIIPRCKCRETY